MIRELVLVVILITALTACGSDGVDEPPSAASPTRSPDAPTASPTSAPTTPTPDTPQDAEGWQTCRNDQEGYSIGYPEDWHTDFLGPASRCRWFDREPFGLEPRTDGPTTDLLVNHEARPFDRAVSSIGDRGRVITRERTEVAGRDALRFELEIKGSGFYPEGTLRYGYLVSHPDGRTLSVQTIDVGSDGHYDDNKEIVDTAVSTLEFGGGADD